MFVFAHAGGFVRGDKRIAGTPYYDNVALGGTQRFHRRDDQLPVCAGCTWPSGGEDVAGTVTWLAKRGASARPRIVLMGHSSGSTHVADYVAAHPAPAIAAAILTSGTYAPDRVTALARAIEATDPEVAARYRARFSAYYGSDESLYATRSAIPGLARTTVPLFIACAEHDPLVFHQQAAFVQAAIMEKRGRMPPSICSPGHTHFSQIHQLNTGPSPLAEALSSFWSLAAGS